MPRNDRTSTVRTMLATLAAWFVLVALLPVSAQAQAVTPPKGSPERAAILDSLRLRAESELGPPVEFVVGQMRVVGEWAYVNAIPQRKGGGPIPWTYTRYQQHKDDGGFEEALEALLRNTPEGWLVYEFALGGTDPAFVSWTGLYPAPPEVFPTLN